MAFSCLLSQEEQEALRHSRAIDRQLKSLDRQKNWQHESKILLLGAGESGKSTFVKQMRIIHGEDYTDEDRLEFRTLIYHNITKGMKVLVEARKRLQIPLSNPENETNGEKISSSYRRAQELSPEEFQTILPYLKSLAADKGIQDTLLRSNEFQLGDAVSYFLTRLDKLGAIDYLPTRDDILHSRKATRGVAEYIVGIKGVQFRFVDVGGQRSQRQKWFSCFDEVTAILFMVASSAFDQTLLEDRVTNRLVESLNIFDTIVNNKCFKKVAIIVFFNKIDILRQKVKRANIKEYFSDFEGDPHNIENVQSFLVSMYNEVRRKPTQDFYYHFTTATDTKNIKVVFDIVRDTVLKKNIDEIMQI